jgi:hypothetical protein
MQIVTNARGEMFWILVGGTWNHDGAVAYELGGKGTTDEGVDYLEETVKNVAERHGFSVYEALQALINFRTARKSF